MKGGSRLTRLVNGYRLKRFDFVTSTRADFSNYFLRFYKLPYDNWSVVSHPYCDFIIRFENLEADFAKALSLIGIEEDIRLPMKNQTAGKRKDFASYYNDKAIERAKHVFGPFMKKWDYEFPVEWGDAPVDWRAQKGQELANLFRKPYWLYLKPFAGRWARVQRTDNEA
jgi:hypothetical protein